MSGLSARGETAAGTRALALGMFFWLAGVVIFWPAVASFADDVGYLGEARLLTEGHLRPQPADVGTWQNGVSKYPLLPSVLLAPLLVVWPRAVFALGIAAALVICWLAGRVLESWGDDPAWALLLLAHPTIVLIARTATADLPQCAFMLGAWWCLRRNRWGPTIACCAGLFAVKATGVMLGAALLGGEMLRRLPALRRGEREARLALFTAAAAFAVGIAAVIVCNELSAGRAWFGYDFGGVRPFSLSHFSSTAPLQLLNVVVIPPLLIAGASPFWQRREYGPLAVIAGFGGAMCFYFFVDFGANRLESLVLAPRLLLPVIVFLLIGYADLLARLLRRVTGRAAIVRGLLIAGALSAAFAIGVPHARQQRPAGQALAAAERIARDRGVAEIGLVAEADKPGIMFSGRVSRADRTAPRQAVLLCSSRSASHRAPLPEGSQSCDLPGYRAAYQADGFFVMTRD